MSSRYHEVYEAWRRDPEGFWAEAARDLVWTKPWDKVFDPDQGVYGRWFVGAECNTAYNCLDRHVAEGRGGQAALIYDSPVTGQTATFTYEELTAEVATLAAVLVKHGVGKGDRVILYMPMIPEAAIAMLACARIGAIHSVVFGGFAARELATRIDDAKPKMILSASCGAFDKINASSGRWWGRGPAEGTTSAKWCRSRARPRAGRAPEERRTRAGTGLTCADSGCDAGSRSGWCYRGIPWIA